MLHFSEDFFKNEVRDGFVISELMKRAWAAQLEVLNKVIEICDKYKLTYYAYWGTLLGTIRHHGYIPWDDDLDIAMKKEDYLTFLEVAKMELPSYYCILNCYTETEWDNVFTRITNGHGLDLTEEYMEQYHNCPLVVGIDIFPLYYLPNNESDAEVQKNVLQLISRTVEMVDAAEGGKGIANNAQVAQSLVELEKITGYRFTTERPIRNQLFILYDQMSQLFGENESSELTIFPNYFRKGYSVSKNLLAYGVLMPFENIMMNVPVGYDAILTKTFGDYMTPRRVKGGHDYPFYKGQLQVWMKYIEMHGGSKNIQLADGWMEKVYPEGNDGKKKKIILYHVDAATLLANGGYALDKLRYVMDIFRDNQNVLLWWYANILDSSVLSYISNITPELYEGYLQIVDEFKNQNYGVYDESGDAQRAIAIADGYFGDEGDVMELFKLSGKPVMIQDYEIGNKE